MNRGVGAMITAVLLIAACGWLEAQPGEAPVPSGATVVHIAASDSGVRLDPSRVPAGDVYLVLDEPIERTLTFVQRQAEADDAPGPLNDGDLARLARGDVMHTSMTGLDAGGCSEDQNRQARGMLGPCGNVERMSLVPGKYAVMVGSPEEDFGPGGTGRMVVLEVTP